MRRLKIGDRLLRVRDEGEGPRTPVVCVHGAGASSVVFMDTVRRLSPRRRIVALDLPGHGQSDRWHPPPEVTLAMYRDAVGTVCAHLKIPRVVLVGHSMGGQIALACAAAWPERVAGLVTVGSGAKIDVSTRIYELIEKDFPAFPDWLARLGWSPATPRPLVERWRGLALTADAEITRADFRAVEAWDGRPLAAKVTCPALVLGGGDDLLVPPPVVKALAERLPNATVEIWPRAGHFLHLEHPDAFHARLHDFLVTAP